MIVVFHDDVDMQAARHPFRLDERMKAEPQAWDYLDAGAKGFVQNKEARHGFRAGRVYDRAVKGFAARLTARQIDDLENDPDVAYVEADSVMTTVTQTLPWGIDRVDADISSTLAGNGSGQITGVNVAVIDTGVYAHTDLNRVRQVNFARDGINRDCNGHGTHVAGTIAAKDNVSYVVGVAPGAPVYGVKVLGCNGSGWTSDIIAGINWVIGNVSRPTVANLSLGGSANKSLDDAVRSAASNGVFVALAAGNSGTDACTTSPARAGMGANGIMTTAATGSTNREASWSNYGNCVDIWAPGMSVLSLYKNGGTATLSGTSMASPHVAGTAALYLSNNPLALPLEVEQRISLDRLPASTNSKNGQPIYLDNARNY